MRPDAEELVRALSGGANITAEDAASRGWTAYQQGDLESALPLFQQAASLPGVKPWALYALGLTHAGLGHPAEAIASWERVRAAAPDYEAVYIDLAATYASQANLTSALAVLRDAEKRWPGNAEIQNGIGVILVRREAYDDAIAAFAKAAAAAPDEAVTHLNLGRAYELRFTREQHFVSSQRRWVAPEGDRRKAAESYERCVALGGPYAAQAAAALGRLNWSK
jgi:tetratricopeptide (TPR) repeat protein